MTDSDFLTPEELASLFKCSTMTIYRRIKDGTIPAIRLGALLRVRRSDVEALLAIPANQEGTQS